MTKNRNIYLYYTFLFVACSLILFNWMFFSDYTTIADGDCLSQHYKAFVYYGNYLRTILKNIFIFHSFSIPQFDINIGEGSDIFQTFCYYCIGDPVALISVFAPEEHAFALFGFSTFLRLYLAGIAFIYMCRNFNKEGTIAILTGVLCYIFVPFATGQIESQVFFINPLFFLPFLIVGVNKLMNGESPIVYILSVFFAALSNFYFFYMLVLLTVLYAASKALFTFKGDIKCIAFFAFRCIFYAFIAFLMAAFLLFPVLFIFTHDLRASAYKLQLLYDIKHYIKLPLYFTTFYEGNLGFAIQSLFAIFVLVAGKKSKSSESKFIKFSTAICLLFILFPFFSQILNGFAYPTSRWCFAAHLLCAYIIVHTFEELCSLKLLKGGIILLANLLYCIFASTFVSNKTHLYVVLSQTAVGFCFLLVSDGFYSKRLRISTTARQGICALLVACSVFTLDHFYIEKNSTITKKEALATISDNNATHAKKLAESECFSSFYRFAQTGDIDCYELNNSPISGPSSTQYYWTLSNSAVMDFRKKLEICDERHTWRYTGHDSRPILTDLAAVRYFCKSGGQRLPQLFHFSETEDESIYKNGDFIPFGYTYSNYVLQSDWERLNGVEKEVALSKAIVLQNPLEQVLSLHDMETGVVSVPFSANYDEDDVVYSQKKVIAKKDNASVHINFSANSKNQLYLRMSDMDFYKESGKLPKWVHFTITTNLGYSKDFDLNLKDYMYYTGKKTYSVNLGYTSDENLIDEITIQFSDKGIYTFTDFTILSLPIADISEKHLKSLAENTLQNVKFGQNTITGNITLDEPKILCLSIPYLDGWKAKVDGKEQKLLRANIQYMALELDADKHTVELHYRTPFLRLGAIVSLFGWLFFIVLCIMRKKVNTART